MALEIAAKIKQKNSGTFPLMDAQDIEVAAELGATDNRLSTILSLLKAGMGSGTDTDALHHVTTLGTGKNGDVVVLTVHDGENVPGVYVYNAGKWTLIGKFELEAVPGPAGPQGEQGIPGEPGQQGPEGPEGPTGKSVNIALVADTTNDAPYNAETSEHCYVKIWQDNATPTYSGDLLGAVNSVLAALDEIMNVNY